MCETLSWSCSSSGACKCGLMTPQARQRHPITSLVCLHAALAIGYCILGCKRLQLRASSSDRLRFVFNQPALRGPAVFRRSLDSWSPDTTSGFDVKWFQMLYTVWQAACIIWQELTAVTPSSRAIQGTGVVKTSCLPAHRTGTNPGDHEGPLGWGLVELFVPLTLVSCESACKTLVRTRYAASVAM